MVMDTEAAQRDAIELKVLEEALNTIDPELLQRLPLHSEVKGISPHSTSFWTRTGRIRAVRNGREDSYFLKLTCGERGLNMVRGEFLAMERIHGVKPDFVPRPIGYGSYSNVPGVHFLLCDFCDMETTLPDVESFTNLLSDVHNAATSLNGEFGFDCLTYHGNVPIEHGWHDTWEQYFTTTTQALLETEQITRGRDDTIAKLTKPFFEEVVVRLLRPLETNGRSIKPSLIHGDLWHGNAAVKKQTCKPIIFDAAGFYAHNEYELAVWRQPWNEIGEPFRRAYCKHNPPLEPQEDFEDRGLLYSTRVNILDSILYKDDTEYRAMLIHSMQTLVSKYASNQSIKVQG